MALCRRSAQVRMAAVFMRNRMTIRILTMAKRRTNMVSTLGSRRKALRARLRLHGPAHLRQLLPLGGVSESLSEASHQLPRWPRLALGIDGALALLRHPARIY